MPLDQSVLLEALQEDVAEFVGTSAREAAGTDELRLEWWWLVFGTALIDFGRSVREAVRLANQVVADMPVPLFDQ